jgi:mannosyltransferase OCH1-like enzyme
MIKNKKSFHQILIVDDYSNIEIPDCTNTVSQYFDINYKLWDNDEIRYFLSNEFSEEVLQSYDILNAYAMKADLARYCILYKMGGWYSDINNTFTDHPPDTKNTDFIFFMDIPESTGTDYAVSNGLMYSKPNNVVYLKCIDKVLKNCKEKFYGENPLFVTATAVFGEAIKKYMSQDIKYIKGNLIKKETDDRASYVLPDGRTICLNKNTPGGVVGIPGTNNYNTIWFEKNVYKEADK